MKTWQKITVGGACILALGGLIGFDIVQKDKNQALQTKIENVEVPNKLTEKKVITTEESKKWEKRVNEGIQLYLGDALPDYQHQKEGAQALSVIFPLPDDMADASHEKKVDFLKKYTYQLSQFQLITAPSKDTNGEAIVHLDWVKHRKMTSSWAQSPFIDLQFNENGYIIGGDFYANAE